MAKDGTGRVHDYAMNSWRARAMAAEGRIRVFCRDGADPRMGPPLETSVVVLDRDVDGNELDQLAIKYVVLQVGDSLVGINAGATVIPSSWMLSDCADAGIADAAPRGPDDRHRDRGPVVIHAPPNLLYKLNSTKVGARILISREADVADRTSHDGTNYASFAVISVRASGLASHVTGVRVIEESIRRGGSTRTAVCICGWRGPDRGTMTLAADDAETHEADFKK